MKKITTLLISLIISFSYINNTNANNLENKLYKWVVITQFNISKDYKNGKNLNKKIETIFIKYRYLKDRKTLNNLEKILKGKLEKFNSKKTLTRLEKRKQNLYLNLYYRTKLLLDYNLK